MVDVKRSPFNEIPSKWAFDPEIGPFIRSLMDQIEELRDRSGGDDDLISSIDAISSTNFYAGGLNEDQRTDFSLFTPEVLEIMERGEQSPIGVNSTVTGTTSFTGTGEQNDYSDVAVSCYSSDQAGTLYFDFSVNGSDWRTFPTSGFVVSAGIHEFHTAVKAPRYFRVRWVSSSAPTTFQLFTYYGSFRSPNSPLNSVLSSDSDSLTVRGVDPEILISADKYSHLSVSHFTGENTDVDTATVPETIWEVGGTYTGFPTGSPETVDIVSTSASDTGTVIIYGLKTSDDTDFSFEAITATGTTTATSVNSWYRVIRAWYVSGSSTAANVGDITVNHTTTTANVFGKILAGVGETSAAVYTVPSGKIGLLKRKSIELGKDKTGYITGCIWYRAFGSAPRCIEPFSASDSVSHKREYYGGRYLQPKSDFELRIDTCSVNDVTVIGAFDIILIDA